MKVVKLFPEAVAVYFRICRVLYKSLFGNDQFRFSSLFSENLGQQKSMHKTPNDCRITGSNGMLSVSSILHIILLPMCCTTRQVLQYNDHCNYRAVNVGSLCSELSSRIKSRLSV